MEAKNLPTKSAALSSPNVLASDKIETIDTSTTCARPIPSTAVPVIDGDRGSRKRPQHDDPSSTPDVSSRSPPRSPSKYTENVPVERARKKVRFDDETEADSIIVRACLRRIERSQVQSGRLQSAQIAQDLHSASLKTILRHLKVASPKPYSATVDYLKTTDKDWAVVEGRTGDGLNHDECVKTQQAIINTVFTLFDCDSLIMLHPYLTGNPRLQRVLQYLDLPLQTLRKTAAELKKMRQKTEAQRQRQTAIKELLVWLCPPQPYPTLSERSTYNDSAARSQLEAVTALEIDEGSHSYQDINTFRENDDQSISLPNVSAAVAASDTHRAQPSQPSQPSQPRSPNPEYIDSVRLANVEKKLDQYMSLVDTYLQPVQASKNSQATENDHVYETPVVLSEAALTEARDQPRRKANFCAKLQRAEKMNLYLKLQTWGEAYNIIIKQFLDAEEGDSSVAHLEDLQIPDSDACYYRLSNLWIRSGEILPTEPEVQKLCTSIDKFYKFAICMREVHCLLRVLNYYGYTYKDVLATGWNLHKVRRLQTLMMDYVHEEPMTWSKPDVDAICAALNEVSKMKAEAENTEPESFAARVTATQTSAVQDIDVPHGGSQALAQQQDGNGFELQHILPALDFIWQQVKQACFGSGDGHNHRMQDTVTNQEITYAYDDVDAMEIDNAPVAPLPQIQAQPKKQVSGVDSPDHYCNNWVEGGSCAHKSCRRFHLPSLSQFVAASAAAAAPGAPSALLPTDTQLKSQYIDAQQQAAPQFVAGKSSIACKFFSRGTCRASNNCKYSHAPAAIAARAMPTPGTQQVIADTTMEGAATTGDNRGALPAAVNQYEKYNGFCGNELNKRYCNSRHCQYQHMNTRSKNFLRNGPRSQPQQRSNQGPALNNTFDPRVHNMSNLGSMMQPQQPQQPWAPLPAYSQVETWRQDVGQRSQPQHTAGLMGPPPLPAHVNVRGANPRGNDPSKQCFNCKELGHISAQCTRPRNNGGDIPRGAIQVGRNQQSGYQRGGHQPGFTPRNGNQSGKNQWAGDSAHKGTCNSCHERGHKQRECPQQAGQGIGNAPHEECFGCGRTGHAMRDCPYAAAQGGENGYAYAPSATTML